MNAARAAGLTIGIFVAMTSANVGAKTTFEVTHGRIVNGKLTSDFSTTGGLMYNSVAGAFVETANAASWVDGPILCTGTLIGCNTFLTAGHCVEEDLDPAHYAVFLQHAGFFEVEDIALHPDYEAYDDPLDDDDLTDDTVDQNDVAVLTLRPPANLDGCNVAGLAVTSIFPSPIDTEDVADEGDVGTIAGFGRSGGLRKPPAVNRDSGLKRFGAVELTDCGNVPQMGVTDTSHICWEFPNAGLPAPPGILPVTDGNGENSNTCHGDSGGPLFIDDDGDGCADPVAGITSGGDEDTCLATDHAYDARVSEYTDFIRGIDPVNAALQADVGAMMCGTCSHVEDSVTIVNPLNPDYPDQYKGSVSGALIDAEGSFEVPAGAVELRVALNASQQAPGTDLDLYVRRGAAPAMTVPPDKCASTGPRQHEFCRMIDPAADTWHFKVHRVAGAGTFQVTVTIIFPMKLKHFQCYETRPPSPFAPVLGVDVVDQFGPLAVDVLRAQRVCAPASKEDPAELRAPDCRAPTDPDHLALYQVRRLIPFQPVLGQEVVNQFGTLSIDVVKPSGLMVPTAKDLDEPTSSPASAFLDHFMCYKARVTPGTPKFVPVRGVEIEDQFGTSVIDLLKPKRLCAPADKNGENPGADEHAGHLLCYKTRGGGRLDYLPVFLLNQFGDQSYQLLKSREFCVPSLKNPPEGSPSGAFVEGDGSR